jgi:hypothetical protein
MNVNILRAELKSDEDHGYVGRVAFKVEGHERPYEVTLQSDDLQDWSYSLLFLNESGREEDILAVEEALENDDSLFYKLVDAAKAALPGRSR